jgi:glucosylglycerate synthase
MSSSPIADISNASPLETAPAVRNTDSSRATLLICLPSLGIDGLQTMQERIVAALPGQSVVLASPDALPDNESSTEHLHLVGYPAGPPHAAWTLVASDFLTAADLAREHNASALMLLGAEAASLSPAGLHALATCILNQRVDLALPRYKTGPHDALVSSALLYPLTNALFGVGTHLPLPLDAAFSLRMGERLAGAARRLGNAAQSTPLVWPAAEASIASYVVREIEVGERTLPHPGDADLNSLLAEVAGSLFTDIEAKAPFWQRSRSSISALQTSEPVRLGSETEELAEVRAMAESFRSAYLNLQEIWSLVLPPQSLLALKKLSLAPPESFLMPADLWARVVYDFVLAYHLRTINRGHLLGALTPLYLAWVTSHLRRSAGDAALSSQHVEETASAFAAEKPYVVARWRWPDRFNP